MPMNVLYLYPIAEAHLALLRAQLDPGIAVFVPPMYLNADGALVGEGPAGLPEADEQVVQAEVVIANWADPALLARAGRLRAFIIPYAGVPARLREPLARFPAVQVYNCHFNAMSVAEHAWALALAVAKRLVECDQALRRGYWLPRYDGQRSVSIRGQTAGIVGYGAIGQAIAAIARAWGLRVLAVRRRPGPGDPAYVRDLTGLHDVLAQSDLIFVGLPLTDDTRGLIGREAFAAMKPEAILVNVARGPVVDEAALYEALHQGRIRGAGIDTWYVYPRTPAERAHTMPAHLPFGELPNVVHSPHRAAIVTEIEEQRTVALADMLNRLARGDNLPEAVDPARGY